MPVDQKQPHGCDKRRDGDDCGGCCRLGDQGTGFHTQRLALPNNGAQIGQSLGNATPCPTMEQQTDDKESKIRHADTISRVLQRIFYLNTDTYLTKHPLEFDADRRMDLTRRQLNRLQHW